MKHYQVGTYKVVRDNKGKFSSFKIKAKIFFKKVLKLSLVAGLVWVAFIIGQSYAYEEKVINIVQADTSIPPVLQRIAKCESGNSHYDKNGQIMMRSNTNRSVDVGRYQINTVWFAKATEMGLDVTKEADNEKMAIWIYENKGTSPWESSSRCWNH